MSEDTQNRLKAFLERNKTRISNPPNEKNQQSSQTQNLKTTSSSQKLHINQTETFLNDSFSSPSPKPQTQDNRIHTDSSQPKDFDGVSFEYQPVSLFSVINNINDEQGFMHLRDVSSRENKDFYRTENSDSDSYYGRSFQGGDSDAYFNSNPFMSSYTHVEKQDSKRKMPKEEQKSLESGREQQARSGRENQKVQESERSHKIQQQQQQHQYEIKKEELHVYQEKNPFETKQQQLTVTKTEFSSVSSAVSNKKNESNSRPPNNVRPQEKSIHYNTSESSRTDSFGHHEKSEGVSYEDSHHLEKPEKSQRDSLKQNSESKSESEKEKESSKATAVAAAEVNNKEDNFMEKFESMCSNPNEVYSESSKKLTELNESTPHDSGFKKEIKNLIKVIKHEKDQVVKDIKVMGEELNRYKHAYKLLQKQEKAKNGAQTVSQEKKSSEKEQKQAQKSESSHHHKGVETLPQQTVKKDQSYHSEETKQQQNTPPKSNPNLEIKQRSSETKNVSHDYVTSPEYELNKDAITQFIINDMNLDPTLFFPKSIEVQDSNYKPTIIDLITSQRDIIHLLVKKYQVAERERLKTEEEISKMVSSMETTITQLEKKENSSRSSLSPSPVSSAKKKYSAHY